MATKVVQAFQAIIDLHFGGESDDRKADLLDEMIDTVVDKGIYKSIRKPARKQEVKRRGGKQKGRGTTSYNLFVKSMKENGHSCSPREMADLWADAKENNPNLVAWLKLQAQLKNNGEDYDLEMPEDYEAPTEPEPEKKKKKKKKPEPESDSEDSGSD